MLGYTFKVIYNGAARELPRGKDPMTFEEACYWAERFMNCSDVTECRVINLDTNSIEKTYK